MAGVDMNIYIYSGYEMGKVHNWDKDFLLGLSMKQAVPRKINKTPRGRKLEVLSLNGR